MSEQVRAASAALSNNSLLELVYGIRAFEVLLRSMHSAMRLLYFEAKAWIEARTSRTELLTVYSK